MEWRWSTVWPISIFTQLNNLRTNILYAGMRHSIWKICDLSWKHLVECPEQYRWNSLGYHIQTGNEKNFLSLDFGLKEFGILDAKERLKHYRRYVYEAGSISRPEKGKIKVIEDKVIEMERSRGFELSKSDRFRYRTRYFTGSGIIGSKQFVSVYYQRFKNLFSSKHEKKPKPIKGLEGVYSLKRLFELIWKTVRISCPEIQAPPCHSARCISTQLCSPFYSNFYVCISSKKIQS